MYVVREIIVNINAIQYSYRYTFVHPIVCLSDNDLPDREATSNGDSDTIPMKTNRSHYERVSRIFLCNQDAAVVQFLIRKTYFT